MTSVNKLLAPSGLLAAIPMKTASQEKVRITPAIRTRASSHPVSSGAGENPRNSVAMRTTAAVRKFRRTDSRTWPFRTENRARLKR